MDSFQLRVLAEELVLNINVADRLPVSCLSEETVNRLSIQTSLGDIIEVIRDSEESSPPKIHETIVWAEGLLRNPHSIVQDGSTVNDAVTAQRWVTEALTTPTFFSPRSHFDLNPAPAVTAIDISRWRLMAVAGLRLLSHLQRLVPSLYGNPPLDLLTSVASFTDSRDPWTRPEASETAEAVLLDILRHAFIADTNSLSKLFARLLQDRVKLNFARTKNSAITEQGRQANYRLPDAVDFGDSEVELKPWKFRNVYILTVFRWILGKLDECTVQDHWPLVIPPLLAILDDEAIENKVKGCELLVTLLKVTSSSLLQKTGLGEVFQDALMPCLSYLPSSTSEEESVRLLNAVNPTLLVLLRARYPGSDSSAKKMAVLDQMLRIGILNGFAHTGEHVRTATVLICMLSDLIKEMGITSIKHLKDLLPLISGILSAPFGPAHPPLLLAAAFALQVIILNCWPRIGYYRGEILKGLTICWCTINEDTRESHDLNNIKIAIQQDVNLLRISVRTNVVELEDMDQLLHDDPQLSDLLMIGHRRG